MSIASIRTLRLLMPLSAVTSTTTQLLAIFTNSWLYTVEYMPNEFYERFKMPAEMEFLKKYTSSGMWVLCQNSPPRTEMHCSSIDYLSQEEYIPDQNDSTMAIPYSMRQALPYILASVLVVALGELIYLCRKVCRHRQMVYTLISGITFILAGLTILAGLVVYISTFKAEVSYKLRPLSEFQEAVFHYRYGYSFLYLVASLILCNLTGTLCIFLYTAQKQFQCMIDSEREEILKKNILSLLAPDIKPHNGDRHQNEQPKFRIICEDENGAPASGGANYAPAGPVDGQPGNFLTVDYGLDPYFYGRHGSRGRRNSRSNESFMCPSEVMSSRKNSYTSEQDEPSQPSSSFAAAAPVPPKGKAQTDHLKFLEHRVSPSSPPDRPPPATGSSPVLLELHVPSLAQLQPFGGARFKGEPRPLLPPQRPSPSTGLSSKKTRFQFASKSNSQDLGVALPYLSMSSSGPGNAGSSASSEQLRSRLCKQSSLNVNPNISTYV